ncbi:MAG: NFYB/HAP3 family transcription factor subunit [Candidatus Lokiarchaeota archaeon]|nr:NFYB/HAP3 family transcription factor subunit [Candidatus Lokiarchaeota archaeon]
MAKKPAAKPKPAAKKKPAAPKAKKADAGYIAKAPIRRLMKKEGADLVAAEALDKLIAFLETSASNATKEAIKICKADKRKRVTAQDIRAATR